MIERIVRFRDASSDLIEYLAQDSLAEQDATWQTRLAAERETLEARFQVERETRLHAEREAQLTQLSTERETLEAMIAIRFPDAPLRLTNLIRKIAERWLVCTQHKTLHEPCSSLTTLGINPRVCYNHQRKTHFLPPGSGYSVRHPGWRRARNAVRQWYVALALCNVSARYLDCMSSATVCRQYAACERRIP